MNTAWIQFLYKHYKDQQSTVVECLLKYSDLQQQITVKHVYNASRHK